MTDHITKADPVAWKQACAKLRATKAVCDRLKIPRDRDIQDGKWEQYFIAKSALLEMPAPDIEAVITKLMLIFAEDLAADAPEALHKCTVIGDLRRIRILGEVE